MRKRLIAAVTAVAVLAAVATAYAVNVYEVDIATITPKGKGTPAKPLPAKFAFGYEVSDSNPANRPSPIRQYRIAPEGLFAYPKSFNVVQVHRHGRRDRLVEVLEGPARRRHGDQQHRPAPGRDREAPVPAQADALQHL